MKDMKKFIPLVKAEEQPDGTMKVYGIVTAERPDRDGEVCHYASTAPYYRAMAEEFKRATSIVGVDPSIAPLRYMHGLDAVGKGTQMDFNDTEKTIMMGFDVVDPAAINKVKKGVLTGFSHGGQYVKTWIQKNPEDGKEYTYYTAKVGEISLVDSPCLETARFEYVKADGSKEVRKFSHEPAGASSSPDEKTTLSTADVMRVASATAAILKAGKEEDEDEEDEEGEDANKTGAAGEGNDSPTHQPGKTPVVVNQTAGDADRQPGKAASGEELGKGKTKRVGDKDLTAENFAYVGDPDKTATWKFPIHDAPHVRNALARWAQAKGIPDGEKASVRAKIEAAAKKFNIEVGDTSEKIKAAYFFMASTAIPENIRENVFKTVLVMADAEGQPKAETYARDVVRACNAAAPEALSKSMWDVKTIADVLMTLCYTTRGLKEEAEWEGDDSAVPADLAALLERLVEIFVALVGEETAELLAAISGQKGASKTMSTTIDLEKAKKSVADHLKAGHAMVGDHHEKTVGMHKTHLDKIHGHIDKALAAYGGDKASGGATHLQNAKAAASAHHDKAVGASGKFHDAMRGHLNKIAKAIGTEEESVEGAGPSDETITEPGGTAHSHEGKALTAADVAAIVKGVLDERDQKEDENIAAVIKAIRGETAQPGASQAAPQPGVGDRQQVVKTGANQPYQTNLNIVGKDQDTGGTPKTGAVTEKTVAEQMKDVDIAKAVAGDTDSILALARTIKASSGGIPSHLSGVVAKMDRS